MDGSSELLTEAIDYCGGDYYGGFLQQTFINKYYKNVSPNLPFVYHTSRCDPELAYHTTTKTEEELMLHVITALVHNGAFLLVDAINPDGSIVPEVYHGLMKRIYAKTSPYEKYVSGNFHHNAAIWFATHAKYNPNENCEDMMQKKIHPDLYLDGPVAAASIMRENNIPFEAIGTKNIDTEDADVMILSHVAAIRDEEMDRIEAYVNRGGNLYISGPVGHPRLQKLLGIEVTGRTEHQFTYMRPTEEGMAIFEGFGSLTPLTVPMAQMTARITDPDSRAHSRQQKDEEWEFVVKMTLIVKDIMEGNERLADKGFVEESLGRNALFAGFQGQRMWTDYKPNADFTEAILNSTFDWDGKRAPYVFATENDNLNGLSMVFGNLLTGKASGFSDVRCYWSPEAVERVTGWKPEGSAKEGFIHLINSGSTCLDATGKSKDAQGNAVMKSWWEMTEEDIEACLEATSWCPAELCQFRGGGYSSHFKTDAEMPLTMVRVNLVEGVGPVMQIAEGKSITLPEDVHKKIDDRTDPTWPTTWFVPRTTGEGAFRDVYSVMANWGANHGAFIHGHVGADLITLASMLRIPVVMHNVEEEKIFRPHAWGSFGTRDTEAADMAACKAYGPLYG